MAQAVTEFQSLLGQLAQELQLQIQSFLSEALKLDKSELLSFITDAGPELLLPFITAAADVTAVWYEDQDPASDYTATPADLPSLEDLAAAARWAVLQADPAAAWGGSASRSLFDASRDTVVVNAEREGVRWVRHAREDSCGFCRLLAARSLEGLNYGSEGVRDKIGADGKPTGEKTLVVLKAKKGKGQSPGEEYHDNCNCTAVPLRDGTYTAPTYVEQWKRDYEKARDLAGKKAGAIANAMDYLPGGRRYKGDDAPAYEPRKNKPVNLDRPRTKTKAEPKADTAPPPAESEAEVAKRLLPGFEESLANLRAQGLPENSPQIQYHLTQIARLKRQIAAAR